MFDKLVDLLITWMKLFFFTFVLHNYERGIVLRFGKFVKEVGPGIHFKWPFDVDEVFWGSVTPNVTHLDPQSLTTKDDVTVVVSVMVTFQIEDIRKVFLDFHSAGAVIQDATYGVVSDFVMKRTWPELRNAGEVEEVKEIDIENEVTKRARRRAKKFGVDIIRVQFQDLTKSRSMRLMGLMGDTHFV